MNQLTVAIVGLVGFISSVFYLIVTESQRSDERENQRQLDHQQYRYMIRGDLGRHYTQSYTIKDNVIIFYDEKRSIRTIIPLTNISVIEDNTSKR